MEGFGLVCSTNRVDDFVAELWSASLERVVVIARATTNAALIEAALVDFAGDTPGTTVIILLFDNRFLGDDEANAYVPLATSTWYKGFSATQYWGLVSTDPEDRATRSVRGYRFPSFEGVEVVRLRTAYAATKGQRAVLDGHKKAHNESESTRGGTTPGEECQLYWNNQITFCNTNRDDRVALCKRCIWSECDSTQYTRS